MKNVGIHIFKKEGHENTVKKANVDYLFPWSPTWGEINYHAYNLATVDFHNELFGFIQEKIAEKETLKKMDLWLEKVCLIKKDYKWTKDGENFEDVTLLHFVRNHIHHPENIHMKVNGYTQSDLENSIGLLVDIMKKYNFEQSLIETA